MKIPLYPNIFSVWRVLPGNQISGQKFKFGCHGNHGKNGMFFKVIDNAFSVADLGSWGLVHSRTALIMWISHIGQEQTQKKAIILGVWSTRLSYTWKHTYLIGNFLYFQNMPVTNCCYGAEFCYEPISKGMSKWAKTGPLTTLVHLEWSLPIYF